MDGGVRLCERLAFKGAGTVGLSWHWRPHSKDRIRVFIAAPDLADLCTGWNGCSGLVQRIGQNGIFADTPDEAGIYRIGRRFAGRGWAPGNRHCAGGCWLFSKDAWMTLDANQGLMRHAERVSRRRFQLQLKGVENVRLLRGESEGSGSASGATFHSRINVVF